MNGLVARTFGPVDDANVQNLHLDVVEYTLEEGTEVPSLAGWRFRGGWEL